LLALSLDLKALEWFVFVKRIDSKERGFKGGKKQKQKRKKGKIFKWAFAYQEISSLVSVLPLPTQPSERL
jgi:hypothetical protein